LFEVKIKEVEELKAYNSSIDKEKMLT